MCAPLISAPARIAFFSSSFFTLLIISVLDSTYSSGSNSSSSTTSDGDPLRAVKVLRSVLMVSEPDVIRHSGDAANLLI